MKTVLQEIANTRECQNATTTVYTLPCAIQLSNAIEQICEFANLPSVGIRNIKNEEISLSNTAQYLSFTWLSSLSKVKYIQNTKYVKHKILITENTAIVRQLVKKWFGGFFHYPLGGNICCLKYLEEFQKVRPFDPRKMSFARAKRAFFIKEG